MEIPRIDRSNIGILLIDVQPAFLDDAFSERSEGRESLLVRYEHLLMLADWMDLPLIATFEIPISQNGELPERLEAVFPRNGLRYVKNYFGCTYEGDIRNAIERLGIQQVAVAGAETDVCILQSVLGLLQSGYQVFLLEDCLFTTEPQPGPALRRMYKTGAIPCSLKSIAYELVEKVDNIPWYEEGWNMIDHPGAKPLPEKFIPPEQWPAWEPKF
jgi:nicotinamidase-related amidase